MHDEHTLKGSISNWRDALRFASEQNHTHAHGFNGKIRVEGECMLAKCIYSPGPYAQIKTYNANNTEESSS